MGFPFLKIECVVLVLVSVYGYVVYHFALCGIYLLLLAFIIFFFLVYLERTIGVRYVRLTELY